MTIGLLCLSAAIMAAGIAFPVFLAMGRKARQQAVKLECPPFNQAQLEAIYTRVTPTQGCLRAACERKPCQRHVRQRVNER